MRRSSNSGWIPPGGMNSTYFGTIGGADAGSLDNRFPGLLGAVDYHDNASALKNSKTSVGTLFMGSYQLVKFTSAVTRGRILVWDTLANNGLADYEVTETVAATSDFRAGICLFTDAAATGKFGWIQTGGLASVIFGTVTSAVIGNLVTQQTLTTAVADAIADAGTTFATNGGAKTFIGIAYELPATGTVTRVLLNPMGFYPNVPKG